MGLSVSFFHLSLLFSRLAFHLDLLPHYPKTKVTQCVNAFGLFYFSLFWEWFETNSTLTKASKWIDDNFWFEKDSERINKNCVQRTFNWASHLMYVHVKPRIKIIIALNRQVNIVDSTTINRTITKLKMN